jgi:hypothetical protein
MNVRVFLLIAMTAFFGVLWSSDRAYQVAQIATARSARRQRVVRQPAVAQRPAVSPATAGTPTDLGPDGARLIVRALLGPAAELGVAGLDRWGARIHSRMLEECCTLRFRTRMALFFTRRRAAALIRERENWRDIASRLGRDALKRLEPPASAAVPKSVETE